MLPEWMANKAVYGIALIAGLGTVGYLLLKRERPPVIREFEKEEEPFTPIEMEAPDNIPEPDDFAWGEIPTVACGPVPGTPPSGPPIEAIVVPPLDWLN